MAAPRIIKKYPNRRLYDTELSRYVTLAEIRGLVMEGVEFQVVDTNSKEDLTRSILLQIMLEEESGGEPLFTAQTLRQIIQFYGGTVQGVLAKYLEDSMTMFTKQQEQWKDMVSTSPMKTFSDLAEQNMKMWGEFQNSFFKAAAGSSAKDDTKD